MNNRLYFFLTFLVILVSGNQAMVFLGKEAIYIGTLGIFLIYWYKSKVRLKVADAVIVMFFSVIMLLHVFSFGSMVLMASMGYLIKLSIALLAVRLISNFSGYYVSVIYMLACISLVFYIPSQLGFDLAGMLSRFQLHFPGSDIRHIGIHNFNSLRENDRNCGIFWESGAFAGYLVLALLFSLRDVKINSISNKWVIVMVVALLTTKSTTGYMALLVLVVLYLYQSKWVKGRLAKLFFFPLIVLAVGGVAYVAVNEISFLGEKITGQFNSARNSENLSEINRFGNFMYDIDFIEKRPLLGWSGNPVTRLSVDPNVVDFVSGQGNGLTGFAVRFGLIGLLVYFYFLAGVTRRMSGSVLTAMFGILIVGMLLMGEQFLNYPIFFSLMFIPKNKSKSLLLLPVSTTYGSISSTKR